MWYGHELSVSGGPPPTCHRSFDSKRDDPFFTAPPVVPVYKELHRFHRVNERPILVGDREGGELAHEFAPSQVEQIVCAVCVSKILHIYS